MHGSLNEPGWFLDISSPTTSQKPKSHHQTSHLSTSGGSEGTLVSQWRWGASPTWSTKCHRSHGSVQVFTLKTPNERSHQQLKHSATTATTPHAPTSAFANDLLSQVGLHLQSKDSLPQGGSAGTRDSLGSFRARPGAPLQHEHPCRRLRGSWVQSCWKFDCLRSRRGTYPSREGVQSTHRPKLRSAQARGVGCVGAFRGRSFGFKEPGKSRTSLSFALVHPHPRPPQPLGSVALGPALHVHARILHWDPFRPRRRGRAILVAEHHVVLVGAHLGRSGMGWATRTGPKKMVKAQAGRAGSSVGLNERGSNCILHTLAGI